MFAQDINGLTNEQIMRATPSVFAVAAHESRSDRYGYIPTSVILDALRESGFAPTTVMQARARTDDRKDFTKHLLRLRRTDDLGDGMPDVHEVVLVNSHDGTSAYKLYGGVFRIACTNGLVVGDINSTMSVRHQGDIVGQVVEGTLELAEESEEVMEDIAEMKQIELTRPEQLLLAQFAMHARFDLDDEEGQQTKEVIYQPADFLRVHRSEDRGQDLYTTTNIIQENLIQGGVSRRDQRGKRHTTRKINGIDQNVKTNRLLWQFSQELLKFKTN